MYDVIIIGAGVTGSAVANELMRCDRKVAVLEKGLDVCEGTSKANSGIVHAGFDATPGSLKAILNVEGNRIMEKLSKELDFSFRRNGSLVLCFREEEKDKLKMLYEKGVKNGVQELQLLSGEEARKLEPNLSQTVVAALYAPTGGIVCPFGLTIAFAENAFVNGAKFYFGTEVTAISKIEGGYFIHTTGGDFESRIVVNAAGVYADKLHNMISEKKMTLVARKGEYCLFDKQVGGFVSKTIFQLPTEYGKGVLITPTIHGNLLLGPTAEDIWDKDGLYTTGRGLEEVLKKAALSVNELPPMRQNITSFAGLRAHEEKDDFIIGEVEDAKGFIDVAGIESPGLTCAPAIGSFVAEIINGIAPAKKKEDYISQRIGIKSMTSSSLEEQKNLINQDPAYANVICRCEMVTEGEILDAIHRPLGARTLDGIKRRTRAGSGRCQAGFCLPKTMEILAREWKVDKSSIVKSGEGSYYLTGYNKQEREGGSSDEI
ncbi:MAG: dependent oxidoreductase [Herbinix sp.]|nr:dependent oxidoreductase [Herbinix sp.]